MRLESPGTARFLEADCTHVALFARHLAPLADRLLAAGARTAWLGAAALRHSR